jgi:DNA-binding transcriptional regulator YdaS (Cro superfamily)
MDLKTFLSSAPRGSAVAISRALGVSEVMVSQWSKGVKAVPVKRCAALEAATHGAVTRKDLRPNDWHELWPELAPRRRKSDRTRAPKAD